MARFSAGGIGAGAGTNLLPQIALAAASGSGGILREIGITNTTTTACQVFLVKLTTAGTPGSAWAITKHDPNSPAAAMVCSGLYTSTGPTLVGTSYNAAIPAYIGGGVIWTPNITIAAGVANGLGIAFSGTGQVLQIYMVWDE